MRKEYIEALVLLGAIGIGIYLTKPSDKIIRTSSQSNPQPEGLKGGFANWTDDEMVYDDHLYKNMSGGLKGLKLK